MDAAQDALESGDLVRTLYFTCRLNSTVLAAGAPVVLPKDCSPPAFAFPDVAESAQSAAQVQDFRLSLEREVAEAMAAERGIQSSAIMGDWGMRKLISKLAGPDAAWYITIPRLRIPVLEELESDLRTVSTPYILIAHSLGSVISLELLSRGLISMPDTFVTVGSPLAWGAIRRRLPTPTQSFPRWINIYDPNDGANKFGPMNPDDYPTIDNLEVDNPPVDGNHDLYGYLTAPEARRRLRDLVTS